MLEVFHFRSAYTSYNDQHIIIRILPLKGLSLQVFLSRVYRSRIDLADLSSPVWSCFFSILFYFIFEAAAAPSDSVLAAQPGAQHSLTKHATEIMFLLFSYFFAQNIHIFLCFIFISTKHSPKNVPSLFTLLCSKFSYFVFFFFISTKQAPETMFLLFSYFFAQNFHILFMFYFHIDKTCLWEKVSYLFIFLDEKRLSFVHVLS